MRATVMVALLVLANPAPSGSKDATLVVHLSHRPNNAPAALMAEAIRKACGMPASGCRIAALGEATTFLHLDAQPEQPGSQVLLGRVDIKSQVMAPGSVSARDRSPEQLALRLLTSVKLRQAKRTGVIEVPSGDARSAFR